MGICWQRNGNDWDGMSFGPEISGFTSAGYGNRGVYDLHNSPNATVVRQMLMATGRAGDKAAVDKELRKWADAQSFFNLSKRIDFAYDGIFWEADVKAFCDAMAVAKPDLVFVDNEASWSYSSWRQHVMHSKNAADDTQARPTKIFGHGR